MKYEKIWWRRRKPADKAQERVVAIIVNGSGAWTAKTKVSGSNNFGHPKNTNVPHPRNEYKKTYPLTWRSPCWATSGRWSAWSAAKWPRKSQTPPSAPAAHQDTPVDLKNGITEYPTRIRQILVQILMKPNPFWPFCVNWKLTFPTPPILPTLPPGWRHFWMAPKKENPLTDRKWLDFISQRHD